jgi:hypothetical protein
MTVGINVHIDGKPHKLPKSLPAWEIKSVGRCDVQCRAGSNASTT